MRLCMPTSGPADTPITRAILTCGCRTEAGCAEPDLYLRPGNNPRTICCLSVAKNICECSKPHISNGPVNDKIFTKGRYGVVSCYNSLPLAGGGSTLVRLNLKAIAEHSTLTRKTSSPVRLPHYCQQQIAIIDARCDFLYEQSGFFENSFLVKEGLIDAGSLCADVWHVRSGRSGERAVRESTALRDATARTSRPMRWATASANSLRRLLKTRR